MEIEETLSFSALSQNGWKKKKLSGSNYSDGLQYEA